MGSRLFLLPSTDQEVRDGGRIINAMTTHAADPLSSTAVRRLAGQDLFAITLLDGVALSPTGEEVLFAETVLKRETNECESRLMLARCDGRSTPGPFTAGPHDSGPRWSPDGARIAFLRKIEEHQQLFVIPRGGGEARRLTRCKNTIAEFSWSPDGRRLAFTAAVTEKGLIPLDEKPEEDPAKKYNEDVKVIGRIWYKLDGKGFLHDRRVQLFLVSLEDGGIRRLTFGDHEASAPAFTPDGKHVVFASNRNPDSDHEPLRHIHLVPVEGGEPRNLTPGDYALESPSVSPDGTWVACIGTDEPYNSYANPQLWVVPLNGGKPESLTRAADRPVGNCSIGDLRGIGGDEAPVWSSDGRRIHVTLSDGGAVWLASVDRATREIVRHAAGENVVYGWSVAPAADLAVLARSSPTIPNDLWLLDLFTGRETRLTESNAAFLAEVSLAVPEPFTAASSDGTLAHGWILKPTGFDPGKKHPAVLEIHGGPMAMYGWQFFFEFQLLASRGFVVIYSNPRGSLGYGQRFCEAIKGEWGNKDYRDLMAILDAAVAKGFIDEGRLGVAGGSYGGFMTNWIVGRTDRFKAAVTMRSMSNWHSDFGSCDYGFFNDLHFDGALPWTDPERYLQQSPISYVEKIRTPLLILHSEEDHRCPVEQAEQLFTALKKLKREVLFVRFPGESHDLSRTGKPWHRVFRLDRIVEWFEKHLKE